MSQKSIGVYNAAFPTPIVVVGAMVDGKPNWFEVAWVGIAESNMITLSVDMTHETCRGINQTKRLSISLVDESLLSRADYVGSISGKKTDKSRVFAYRLGESGAPVLTEAPVSMECELADTYQTDEISLLICRIIDTHVEEALLDEKGKIDYDRFKPIMFEPRFKYLRAGATIGPCFRPGKEYSKE
ncbi:MAG: flavin reductase family protein, partial [Paludibacteraceae bacterium]|nr:flavin reductase family protein [Paludibacteraceae bacterium]